MLDMVARSAADLERLLAQSRVGFQVARKPAEAAAPKWRVIDGALQHESRGFFSASGVRFGAAGDALMLYQPQGAVTGVITARIGGERCWLLQARAEPGCLGEAQFGPTVQSTPANFMRLHAGATTPYVDAFIAYDPHTAILDDTTQLDLGERYLFKSKRSILLETSAPAAPRPAFVWASRAAVYEALQRSAFLNIDLRSVISISPWSSREESGELTPRSRAVQRSLDAELRENVLGAVAAQLRSPASRRAEFVPLEALGNWQATEWGWSEREPRQGFAVNFYEVTAAYREVGRWIQPLVDSASEGHAALACRERAGRIEVFVRALAERGLATSVALAPSYLRYPGARGEAPAWVAEGRTWSETRESDEGGRFYQDASRYQLVRVDDVRGFSDDGGAWLTLAELKLFLRTSNACTIQLRGIVSQLLAGA